MSTPRLTLPEISVVTDRFGTHNETNYTPPPKWQPIAKRWKWQENTRKAQTHFKEENT